MASVFRRGLVNIVRQHNKLRYASPLIQHARGYAMDDDGDISPMRTTVTFLNEDEEGGIFIDSYSNIGFKLNSGLRVFGPCAVFPRSILHWNIKGAEDISEESLSLFTMLEPKLDILVMGFGEKDERSRINPNIIRFLRSKKVNLELLPTDQALATFNFLNSEKRYVAGAFIPPRFIPESDDVEYIDFAGVDFSTDPAMDEHLIDREKKGELSFIFDKDKLKKDKE